MAMFFVPAMNIMGTGSLKEVGPAVSDLGYKKAFIVTDKFLVKHGIVKKVTDVLEKASIPYVIFDEVIPNPTCKNVNDGFEMLKEENCDFIISIGGGSPQDAACAISILATNGGNVRDYEGVNKSKNPGLPIVAVNTTSGTSSEVTIFYVITDEERHVKMVMVDKNCLATITVNDPELMVGKPADLTAATGMDCLTHAIEALVSKIATPVTDKMNLGAVEIVFEYLPKVVKNGSDIKAREMMTYATFLAGVGFSNGGLGYVHAMAHQLGGVYDLPHGVCNAMLLAHVEEENAKYVPERFIPIARALDFDVKGKTPQECAAYVIEKLADLASELGIPKKLSELGINEVDLDLLADNALVDTCAALNPVTFTKEQVKAIYAKIV